MGFQGNGHERLVCVVDGFQLERRLILSRFGTYSVSEAVNAGLDLEMPGPPIWRGDLIKYAAGARKITNHTLDERIRKILNFVNLAIATGIPEDADESTRDTKETAQLLRQISADSLVLLKNERDILPLSKNKSVRIYRLVVKRLLISATDCSHRAPRQDHSNPWRWISSVATILLRHSVRWNPSPSQKSQICTRCNSIQAIARLRAAD